MNKPTTAVVERKQIDIVRSDLNQMTVQFKNALPAHIPPERFVRIAMTAISTNPDLQRCDRQELYAELMNCAQDGLLPDEREAAIVLFKGHPRYMPMISGICKKARNSGEIKSMNAHVVYENDEFDSWTDTRGDQFKFRKARGDRGKPILTFAFAITKDDGFYMEEINEEQMADIEKCSRATSGPWKGDFRDEMKRKSAIRRLAKYRLPSSTDLDEMIRRDDDMYDVTPEKSAIALAAYQADRDFLPGISPEQTAKTFCERLKSVPGGADIVLRQIDAYQDRNDQLWAQKLFVAAREAGIPVGHATPPLSGAIANDEKLPFEKEGN